MALCLSPEQRMDFCERYEADVAHQHGRPMRDFVAVPRDLVAHTSKLQPWFTARYEWTGTLKTKPTTRTKA